MNSDPSCMHAQAWHVRATNDANGFDPPTWENIPTKLMFAVTELCEAMEAINGTGEDPLPEELADTAIRLLDILHSVWDDSWADRTENLEKVYVPPQAGVWKAGEVALWRPLRMLSTAAEAWRFEARDNVRIALEIALKDVFTLSMDVGADLRTEIARKLVKNAERGARHGKARSEG